MSIRKSCRSQVPEPGLQCSAAKRAASRVERYAEPRLNLQVAARRLRGFIMAAQGTERDDEQALIEANQLVATHRAAHPFQCLLIIAIHVMSLAEQTFVPE